MTAQSKIEPPPAERLELALAEALPKLGAALKNKDNPHFKSKFADLGAVIDAIRPVAEQGIWFRQVLHDGPEGVTIETLYTGFGATVSAGTLYMPAAKKDAQGFGSALTYARRYALQTAFGLATEDDDGQAAVKTVPIREEKPAYNFPDGPATGITQLKAMTRELWREVAGCGDEDQLLCLLEMTENKELIDQLSRLEDPAHRTIWEGDGQDNPGLYGHIQRKQAEFKAELLRA